MVFAAVGMTDGTRICPGGHNENMRELPLWLTQLTMVFCVFFVSFLRNFVVLFRCHKKLKFFLNIPARRGVTSWFVASLVRLMMVFCRKTCAPPKKTAGMTLALDTCVEILRVGKLRVSLGGQRHSWRKRANKDQNKTQTELGLYQNPVNGRSSLPTRFFELVLPVLLDFSETVSVSLLLRCLHNKCLLVNITLDHAQQQVNTEKTMENWHVHGYLLCIGAEMLPI